MCPHSVQIVHRDIPASDELKDAILTYLPVALIGAVCAVVVEEAVEARAIDCNGV